MYDSKRIVGIAGRVAAISLGAIIFAPVLPCGGFAATQKATNPSTSEEASPKQIQELITLLDGPKVRNWLEQQSKAQAAAEQAATEESASQALVGIAVGFGAQTFARDVIAGMFYLPDDAFRVGEYIQAGRYKGTVEGFSIRSVRLRHHRGPVFTVPFNLLGAVENMSRDWVIDKIAIGVTYDSDLEKARKLIKQIGLELQQDPEFAPLILEPLKMQGVDELGDYAVTIRAKMMTVPGEQFVIRRKAYAMIKRAFDENGIKFAFPTVQVAGEAEPATATAAVAQRGLELTRPAAA